MEQPGTEVSTGVLEQFGRDLTQLARQGELQPIIGRESEILQVIQILMAEHKANPILVGDAGVGKTAIVEGLAQLIAQGNVPPVIADRHIRSIEMGALLAGTMYRGQFEERLTKLIEEAAADEGTILFIDEIHTLIGTGASGAADTLDAANILKPALSRGTLRCIGTTTYDEYRRHIQRDPALERRFQPVYVGEPSNDEALEILRGLKGPLRGVPRRAHPRRVAGRRRRARRALRRRSASARQGGRHHRPGLHQEAPGHLLRRQRHRRPDQGRAARDPRPRGPGVRSSHHPRDGRRRASHRLDLDAHPDRQADRHRERAPAAARGPHAPTRDRSGRGAERRGQGDPQESLGARRPAPAGRLPSSSSARPAWARPRSRAPWPRSSSTTSRA